MNEIIERIIMVIKSAEFFIKPIMAYIIEYVIPIGTLIQWFLPKKYKMAVASLISQKNFKSVITVFILVFIGIVAPVFLLLKSISDLGSLGWLNIVILILSVLILLSNIVFWWITYKTFSIVKKYKL